MKSFLRFPRLKDISIAKKLYFIVGTMAVLIAVELFILWFAIHTLSSVRALVGAEGLWSKAQKDAAYQLQKYCYTHKENDYKAFLMFMNVPLGDHKTRTELMKPNPDMTVARQGFLEGRNHANDIDGMIRLLRRFHSIYYIHKAIVVWSQGDSIIARLLPIGEKLHREISSASPSKDRIDATIAEVEPINQKLTLLEDDFSYTLGEGSRWLENLILKILFSVALTVEITGLMLSISVSRGITKGLNEINRAARKIANGDFSERVTVFSTDEIGMVASTINQMTEQLISFNKEMEQFAYVASHDLQEPLRTITNFSSLLNKQYQGQLDENANEYLGYLLQGTTRMQAMVRDLLDYSRIGRDRNLQQLDCNKIIHNVISDLDTSITESNAQIEVGRLPVVSGYSELNSLFQNLISNAIKYKQSGVPLHISIGAVYENNYWLFSIRDNGIGIEPIYYERIFVIFQKLHKRELYPGTGIGLAYSKKIVELHGGRIWVESEPGIGSTFYFTIPDTR